MATGTSLAFPYPIPTTSRSSPTATSAVNEKRRPPLTTLATRLISTTRSCRSRPAGLTERSIDGDMAVAEGSGSERLDGQSRLAHGLGERLDVAVVAVAPAVEQRLGDAGRLRALGEQGARAGAALGFAERAQLGLVPVDGGERAARGVVHELRADTAVGA